ncbi:Unknown protein, partial [Striga hermonthica]
GAVFENKSFRRHCVHFRTCPYLPLFSTTFLNVYNFASKYDGTINICYPHQIMVPCSKTSLSGDLAYIFVLTPIYPYFPRLFNLSLFSSTFLNVYNFASKYDGAINICYPHQIMAPTQAMVVAQFHDYHAEKFSGQGDPRIIDKWIQGLEFIFEVMECPDRYRVVCAQLQLTGDARLWWNAYWSMRPGEKAGCTWDMFKELVRDKYYPSYYQAEMERQFLALQQGTRTVDEYEREFTRLAGFAPDLVRTEAQRAQRFIDGLYPAVRHNI